MFMHIILSCPADNMKRAEQTAFFQYFAEEDSVEWFQSWRKYIKYINVPCILFYAFVAETRFTFATFNPVNRFCHNNVTFL